MQTPFLGVALHSALAHLQFLQIDPKPCTPRGMQPERTRPKEGWVRGWAGGLPPCPTATAWGKPVPLIC